MFFFATTFLARVIAVYTNLPATSTFFDMFFMRPAFPSQRPRPPLIRPSLLQLLFPCFCRSMTWAHLLQVLYVDLTHSPIQCRRPKHLYLHPHCRLLMSLPSPLSLHLPHLSPSISLSSPCAHAFRTTLCAPRFTLTAPSHIPLLRPQMSSPCCLPLNPPLSSQHPSLRHGVKQ